MNLGKVLVGICFVAFLFYCQVEQSQRDPDADIVKQSKNETVDFSCDMTPFALKDSVLISLGFQLVELSSNDIKKGLRFFQPRRVIPMHGIDIIDSTYSVWNDSAEDLEIWSITIGNQSQLNTLCYRLNAICISTSSKDKTMLQKMYRNFYLTNESVIFVRHKIFSDRKRVTYKELLDYLDSEFTCW